jgi:SAM-dependent methyltransferase
MSPIPEGYEKGLVPTLMIPCAREALARLQLPSDARVLDVAAGTGALARQIAGRVVAVDAWDDMMPGGRKAAPRAAWVVGDMERLPVRDASFGAALCQHGLAFAEDPVGALREMRRSVRPGGLVAVVLWTALARCPGFEALGAAVERALGEERGLTLRFPHALETEAGLRGLLAEAGLRSIHLDRLRIEARFRDASHFVHAYVEGSYLVEVEGIEAILPTLVEEVEAALAGWTGPEGLVFPVEAHLAWGTA